MPRAKAKIEPTNPTIPLERPESKLTWQDHVPAELFGKDHWSMFAYVESRLVDYGRFVIQCDPRTRTARHNWRILNYRNQSMAILMDAKYGSRLKDGTYIPEHDDWDCLQDLVKAGLLYTRGDPDVSKSVKLTQAGTVVAASLRKFKTDGGTFHTFSPPDVSDPAVVKRIIREMKATKPPAAA